MNKSKNIRVVNLADYERPTIHEVSNKEWVMYGDNNDYFDVIIERYLGSPTNASCVNGISDMIFGRGLEAVDRQINRDAYIEMKRLIDERELRKIVGDRKFTGHVHGA